MPIKYAELTIIHDQAQAGLFSTLAQWFGREQSITPHSKMVFLFDEGDVYDRPCVHAESQYAFTYLATRPTRSPAYFEKNNGANIYFCKPPRIVDDVVWIDFRELFPKYPGPKQVPSKYNCIFYSVTTEKKEVFGILRIQSGEYMPRFRVAYESTEFTKEEVMEVAVQLFMGES